MCFAPQRRALFWHLKFQKWSGPGVFCTFWLGNVLRATTACNFSSLVWPNGSAPAALASLLFGPPEPQIIWKPQCFATFLPFLRTWIFFLLRLSLFWSSFFFSLLFSSLTLPTCAFPSVHIVGSLTSKLPSANDPNWIVLILSNFGSNSVGPLVIHVWTVVLSQGSESLEMSWEAFSVKDIYIYYCYIFIWSPPF